MLLSQVLCALIESVVLLLVSATVLAATTATQLTDDHAVARSFVFTVSQLPGMVAAIGIAAALVGLAPETDRPVLGGRHLERFRPVLRRTRRT